MKSTKRLSIIILILLIYNHRSTASSINEEYTPTNIETTSIPTTVDEAKNLLPPPKKHMENCQDVSSSMPNSSFNYLSVLHAPLNSLGYTWEDIGDGKVPISVVSELKTTLIKTPNHGVVQLQPDGYFWLYKPDAGYLGKDSVTFLIDAKEQQFEVVWNLNVVAMVNEFIEEPACLELFKDTQPHPTDM